MTNYCHLSYEDRKNIEDGLNNIKTINQISIELNKSHSTILREIDRNKVYYKPSNWNNCYNDKCKDYSCNRLLKSPHVCNGCKSRSGCRKERFTYYARKADDSYRELISSSRQGINLENEEIYNINKIITPLVKKGQTTNHLYINHPEVLNFSKVSFYNYINKGVFEYITKKPNLNIVEMDTVEGLMSDSKYILTLFWRKSNFMLMFLLESQTTDEVTKVFEYLQETLLEDDYKRLFQVILTDNGHEFYDVNNIECHHKTGEYISHLFFCDPSASWQKGGIEKNHQFIRYVLPKKTTFKNLSQNDCNIIANHINSLCRESLNNNCPFKAMLFLCDENILNTLNMYYIEPDEVQLNQKLLK